MAFSDFDATAGVYRLMVRDGTGIAALPVAPRKIAFDVDLGPGESGTVAVYSRCATENADWRRQRGCDIYVYDFASGHEKKLAGVSTDQASEYLPAIWRDSVAFVRVYEERSGRRGVYPYLYVRPLAGGRSVRMPGGSRGANGGPGPTALDLYGHNLAFSWVYQGSGEGPTVEMRYDRLGGGHRVVDHSRSGALSHVTMLAPTFDAGRLYFGKDRRQAAGDRVERYRIATEQLDEAPGRPETEALAYEASHFYYLQSNDETLGGCVPSRPTDPSTCRLYRRDTVNFGGDTSEQGHVGVVGTPALRRTAAGIEVTVTLDQRAREIKWLVDRFAATDTYDIDDRTSADRQTYSSTIDDNGENATGQAIPVRVEACNRGGCTVFDGRIPLS